jgi:hypothetical protein
MSKIDDLLSELDALHKSGYRPFPYDGCRRLRAAVSGRHDGLTPDLDMYLSEVAGYRSWGKKILEWPDEKVQSVERRLRVSFFDRYPAYAELQPILASAVAPDVSDALGSADRTRALLLELFTHRSQWGDVPT